MFNRPELPDELILWAILLVGCAATMKLAKKLTVDLFKSDEPDLQEYLDEHFPLARKGQHRAALYTAIADQGAPGEETFSLLCKLNHYRPLGHFGPFL